MLCNKRSCCNEKPNEEKPPLPEAGEKAVQQPRPNTDNSTYISETIKEKNVYFRIISLVVEVRVRCGWGLTGLRNSITELDCYIG